ncbi:glycoside hydrolase family 61 protein [Daldinia sp. FL1419]|nr:glycoside hydrolase family 61 protein [Daldinia sp. FL1419]
MKAAYVATFGLASIVQAHYTFPSLIYNGVTEEDWAYVRKTTNFGVHDHGPLFNVSSTDMRCYELEPGKGSPKIMSVEAGGEVGFRVDGNVTHPGPLQFYMAKVLEGESVKTFAGNGDVWFKIFNDNLEFTDRWPEWPNWGKNEVSVTIPSCLAQGEYLLRVEHIALHNAARLNTAQFYLGCAQLHVSGGGTKTFPGVSFPGAYSATDPGILFDIQQYPAPTSYVAPGPAPISC